MISTWCFISLTVLVTFSQNASAQDYGDVPEGAASLAFVFDITGSMYDDLQQVIVGAGKILATTLTQRKKSLYNYVLVPFHDPTVGPVVVTTEPDDFMQELQDLYVQGGGDCPEMSVGAIKTAIDVSLPYSFIYVFTDARSKDFDLTDEVLELIQIKQSQVVFVLTGDCDDPSHDGFQAYEKIASTSSGQVFLLKKSQVNEVLNFVRVAVQSRKVNLMSVDFTDGGPRQIALPIDSKLQQITISVSGQKPKIFLTDASGNRVTEINGLKKLLDINNALVVNMKEPVPGEWKMEVTAEGPHTIRVTGLSTTDFVSGFSKKAVDSMLDTSHRPIGGIPTFTLINATDLAPPAGFSRIELLDLEGITIAEFPLDRDPDRPNIYNVTSFVPPDHFFYVRVSGIDDKGYVIQRLTPTAINRVKPVKPKLWMPTETLGYYGDTALLTCFIESLVPYTVRFYRNGTQQGVEQYFVDSGNASLEIPNANKFAEGSYGCNATNVAGSRAVFTYLDVTEPPPVITVPGNVSVLPGADALVSCLVSSTVPHNLTWHRAGYRNQLRNSQKFRLFPNGSLEIRNVGPTDEGGYNCRAVNEGGQTSENVYVRVQVPPVAVTNFTEKSFKLGQSVSMKCEGVGFPKPELYWLRAGVAIVANENIRIKKTPDHILLTLRNMQQGDAGFYKCIARNPAGESSARSRLNFIEPPNIIVHKSNVLVASGDEAILFCGAEGIPKPEIHWYKGNIELKAISYVRISDDGQLKILGAEHQDAGEYTCEAINEAGSDKANIQLKVGSSPKITDLPSNLGVEIGGNATIVCKAEGLPPPKIMWQRQDGRKLDPARTKQRPDGTLLVYNVRLKDQGMYSCIAQNQFGTKESAAYLVVTGIVPPLIGYMDPYVTVVQGDDVELHCQVLLGNPTPKVMWFYNGRVLRTDERVIKNNDGHVIISGVQWDNAGDYECVASNVGGNGSFLVTLEVQQPPEFDYTDPSSGQTNFTIVEGEGMTISCDVIGDPPPEISWFKDESPISPTHKHYFIYEDGSLQVHSATADDQGRYRCSASNPAGEIEKTVTLNVQVPPRIAGSPFEEYEITAGTTIVLPCIVSGSPHPEVKWQKGFKLFTPDTDRFVVSEQGLTITNTQVEDNAVYECVASNNAGEFRKVLTLVVQIPPDIFSEGPTDLLVNKDEGVLLECEHTGSPPPRVTWMKDEIEMTLFNEDSGYVQKGTGSLVILAARLTDTARYVCIVENPAGIETRDFSVTVQASPVLPANLTKSQEIIEDNPLVLVCPAVGTPTPIITWYKDGELIRGDQLGVAVLHDGSLELKNVNADDTAEYTCVAENEAGRIDHTVDVRILVPPKLIGPDRGKTDVVDNPKVIVNDTEVLTCPVDGDPPPTVTWFRSGYELIREHLDPRLSISEDGTQLTITQAKVGDQDRYTCVAENKAGEVEKNFDLDVQVPPVVDEDSSSPGNNSVVLDNPLYLDCRISGTPRPEILWYKDEELILPDLDPNIRSFADGRRLEIIGSRITDTGRYKCVGKNVAGETEKNFDVDVHVPPNVEKPGEVEKPEVVSNGSVSLECPASGIPRPDITWYRNSQAIRENSTNYLLLDNGWTLQIVSASVASAARYTCRAKNVAGESEKAFDVNVLVPPGIDRDSIVKNPKVIRNQTTVINCPVDGSPPPEITWYKNDVLLDPNQQHRYEILAAGRQIRVNRAQLTDSSVFRCEAVNKAGKDSVDFDLDVLVPTKINIPRANTNPKVVVDGGLTIDCPATGVPPPTITWFKNGEEIKDQYPNINIEQEGRVLVISAASVEETAHYTCRASNEAGDAEVGYQVDVQVPPTIDPDDVNSTPKVIVNDSVVLNCPAVGLPDPEVIWLKDGLPINFHSNSQFTLKANGKRLLIEGVQLDDTGRFTCIAANEAGSVEQEFDLDVWVPPVIDVTNIDKNPKVNKGHSTVLFCPVDGNPLPEIAWKKGEDPVQYDDRVRMEEGGRQLKIDDAMETDTGHYTCVARNPAGQVSVDMDLEVQVPPSIDESNVVYKRHVVENRTVLLECPVSGIPTPIVHWLINGHPVSAREGLRFTNNNYHLEILRVQVTDTASYTCVAHNEAGELRKKFDLTVLVPPRIDLTGVETEIQVIQTKTVNLDCPVSGIPLPSIIWLKNKIPLLDFPYKGLRLLREEQRLEISDADIDDTGTYTCRAINSAGRVDVEYDVTVFVPPEIVGSEVVSVVPVVAGESTTLSCEVAGIPPPQQTWLKDDGIIILSENPHIKILGSGQALQLNDANVEDSGLYLCHAENLAGIAEKRYGVEVQVPATIQGSGQMKEVWVINNEPLTLDCPATGSPPPEITWTRQGEEVQLYGDPSVRLVDSRRRLLLVNAQLLDEGSYTCMAENAAGNDSLTYHVSIYIPPTIEEGRPRVQSILNTSATLQCESLGIPAPEVVWKKDGTPFPSTGLGHRMLPSGTIEFWFVRLEDAGDYECTATNVAGDARQRVGLEVLVRPRMRYRKPLLLDAVAGKDMVLPCEVTGTPQPQIWWQKGTRIIKGTDGIDILNNGSMHLKNLKTSDSGVYVCIAENNAGTAFFQIRLKVLVPPRINTRKTNFTVTLAKNIVLPCRSHGRPTPDVIWKKDGVLITRTNSHLRLLRQALAIPFATPEDAGSYTCIASNKAGNQSVEMTLTVEVPPLIGDAQTLLTFSVNETAEIGCSAIGIPPPNVTWTKEGRAINFNNRKKYTMSDFGTLIIHQLEESDTGAYTCTATNKVGKDTQNRLLRIQVPPSFIKVPSRQEVLVNSRFEIECRANGIPTPTIHWMHNSHPIRSPASVLGRSVYILPNVRSSDAGMYTCVAENPAGVAESFAMVIVKVPPEILAPPGNKAVSIAGKVTLDCSVGGDPRPEVIWLKNERPVLFLNNRIQMLENGSLVIYNSTSSDAGEYKCVASNDAGTSEGVAMLTVREPPKFKIEPKDTRVEQGTIAIIDCVGEGEPEPEMSWMMGWTTLEDKGRLSILPNNSLRIIAAQLSDSATYRCLASNNLGKAFIEIDFIVVVHGQWSSWSDWGPCSQTCGRGSKSRSRSCDNPEPANDGHDCMGLPVESRTCLERQCPIDGGWGSWLPWEMCSTTCGDGEKVRRRLCDHPRPQFGGEACAGSASETVQCSLQSCEVDGNWGDWMPWKPCSTTCGYGVQERERWCDSPPPRNNGASCEGDGTQRQPCMERECAVDGNWGHWGKWTPCSRSCDSGKRTRQRLCNSPAPALGGLFCVGTDTQVDFCNSEPCPVHGNWAQWGEWGQCSAVCNGGLKRRFRTCSDPQPSNGGRPCPGTGEDTVVCNQIPCAVDGRWSEWSQWSECSKSCDTGMKERQRVCQSPRYGGRDCLGDNAQVMECNPTPCYTTPTRAEGNIVGYINNIDIPVGTTFTAHMLPRLDKTATHVNATIRNLPPTVVRHFRHLISLLSPVYWSSAMEIDGASNGFTLTDGDFTREVQVEYTTGEILKMDHYSKGVDRNGALQLDIVVRGKVPDIDAAQIVKVTPYWEEYLQTGDGNVHAHSTRLFRVNGFMLPYAWNHSIVYHTVERTMPYLVQKLYARNMKVQVNPEQEIVQYELDASIAPGTPSNQCPGGFTLDPSGPFCVDNDECKSDPCAHFCHNAPGSFACSCEIGYTLDIDGRGCIDIDECSTRSSNCRGDQECINTIGSFRCATVCARGLRRTEDGQNCEDIDECMETPDVCDQLCQNRYGSYRCRCQHGYQKVSRGKCVDINECDEPSPPCSQVCRNTPGSYQCGCNPGFELIAAGVCRDVNECNEGLAQCGPNQDCLNSIGSYNCITLCPKGSHSIGNGVCRDVDECATGRHRCYYNQRCVNTQPGYRCRCPKGFHSAGPGTPCIDTDECLDTNKVCSYKCKNTPGGFECICPPGQVRLADKKSCAGLEFLEPGRVIDTSETQSDRDPHSNPHPRGRRSVVPCPQGSKYDPDSNTCIDINECVDDPGVCEHNCTNTVGSYKCHCPPGYKLSNDGSKCIDINECEELQVDCGPEKMCFNTRGEFTCIDIPCPESYQRDPVTRYCVLECIDGEVACPPGAKYADVIEFRTLALPSGTMEHKDLIRLIAKNQDNEILRKTHFKILENDPKIHFKIRLENGIGVLYTLRLLEDEQVYRVKVRAKSYDNEKLNIQYQTTFIIHIAVSAYPY